MPHAQPISFFSILSPAQYWVRSTNHLALEKKWKYNEAVYQLFIYFKKAYDSVRREVLYNILTEFGIPMKLVRLIKMCLACFLLQMV